ncbi:MAG TPA: hypothetical protein VMI31_16635 [Fimbriimonadaceae bacterium]|nr:hypothetical protein [Fimbriimonadaceae bacterium]
MNERTHENKVSETPRTSRACSFGSAKSKKRGQIKARVKVDFDQAVQIILREDAPLLRRLAE